MGLNSSCWSSYSLVTLFEGYLGSLFIYVYKGVLVDMQGCTIAYEWSFWIGLIN